MNTHAVLEPPRFITTGTHQRGRLCLEVARKNTAQPRSRAVAAGSTSSCGVLLAAPYSNLPDRLCPRIEAGHNLAGRPSWRPVPLGGEE